MFRSQFLRLALAVSLVALIGSLLPDPDGTAMAADIYSLGGNNADVAVIQGATIALIGFGIFDGFGSTKSGAAAGPAGPTGSGGGAIPPAINGDKPIYDVTGADPDLSLFYKDETELQDGSVPIGTTLSKDVLRGADNNKTRYTVFAPTDTAVSAIEGSSPAGPINPMNFTTGLTPQNLTLSGKLFAYHIVPGRVLTINDLKNLPGATSDPGAPLVTMDGTDIYVKFTPGSSPSDLGALQVSNAPFGSPVGAAKIVVATIRQTDERASNGIVHPIDAVLVPSSLAGGSGN